MDTQRSERMKSLEEELLRLREEKLKDAYDAMREVQNSFESRHPIDEAQAKEGPHGKIKLLVYQAYLSEDRDSFHEQIQQELDKIIPSIPKRQLMTSFFLFKRDVFNNLQAEFPQLKMTELAKLISERWGNLDEEEKKKYDILADEQIHLHIQKLEEYKNKYFGKAEMQAGCLSNVY
eukprot:TRINITY_DN850_c0_g1_i1.p1 TRINITY_DN850_c0_g1~~TRINITY_DN850_c0_g1_i1.p1  ORF type:complete len:177 (+),score=15.66 TRINITY_DN850_c0_g1_i1:203-733(+)